ncbi:hypothetical protein L1049_001559 [Liquidambar formosana]|uniref:Uncharacterized protein n=1 Tax=Liquidambar formosana TaxID=63359 RepID=A0AAP0ND03_LIQFO
MASMGSSVEVPVFTDTNMGTHIAMAVSPDITSGDFKKELETEHFNCFQRLGEIRVYCLMVKQKSCFYHLPESVPIKHAFQGWKGTWFLHAEASPLTTSDRPGLSECVAEFRDQISNGSKFIGSLEANNCMKSTDKKKTKRKGKKRRIKRSHCLKAVLQGLLVTVYLSKKKKNGKRVKKKYFTEYRANGNEKGCLGGNEEAPGVTTEVRSHCFASGNEVESRKEWNSVPLVEAPSEMSSEVISVTGIIKDTFRVSMR